MSKLNRNKNKGFVLLEVLVVISIISFGLIIIINSVNYSLSALSHSQNRFFANMCLYNKMAEIELNKKTESDFGDIIYKNKIFKWSSEFAQDEINEQLYYVKLKVSWEEKGKMENMTLSTYIYANKI